MGEVKELASFRLFMELFGQAQLIELSDERMRATIRRAAECDRRTVLVALSFAIETARVVTDLLEEACPGFTRLFCEDLGQLLLERERGL